jgi:hypothetical protein
LVTCELNWLKKSTFIVKKLEKQDNVLTLPTLKHDIRSAALLFVNAALLIQLHSLINRPSDPKNRTFINFFLTMNIYVANIPFKASEDELKELFEQHGEVSSVKIILDKETNRSRGFGFIEMSDSESAKQAIKELNGYSFLGKELVVNEARPKTDSPRGGGFGGGNRGGSGGYGNRGGGGGGYNKSW